MFCARNNNSIGGVCGPRIAFAVVKCRRPGLGVFRVNIVLINERQMLNNNNSVYIVRRNYYYIRATRYYGTNDARRHAPPAHEQIQYFTVSRESRVSTRFVIKLTRISHDRYIKIK